MADGWVEEWINIEWIYWNINLGNMLSVFFVKFFQILSMADNFNEKLGKTKIFF